LRNSNNIPRRDFLGSLFWLGTPPKLCGYWSQHVVNSRIDWSNTLDMRPLDMRAARPRWWRFWQGR
jgi:hypothetical protein